MVLSHHVSEVNLRPICFNRSEPLGRSATFFFCLVLRYALSWGSCLRYTQRNIVQFNYECNTEVPTRSGQNGLVPTVAPVKRAIHCGMLHGPHLKAMIVKTPPTASI